MLFRNIPKKQIIIDFIGTIIWSILNIQCIKILSSLISNFSDKNPALVVVIGYLGFILLWEIIEYISDVNIEKTHTYIENNVAKEALLETSKLKPEIIKKYNTGYITGVVSRYIGHKSVLYNCIVAYAPLSAIYVGYAIYKMWTFNIAYGLSLLILIIVTFIIKFIFTSAKDSKLLTEYESNRSKMAVDSTSNIGTVQKMQCIDFVSSKMQDINELCMNQTKKWARKNEASFTAYKFLMYAYLPIALFIYYLNPDSISNKTEFFSFLSIICVQLVHTAQSLAQTLVNAIKYNASLKKLREIYNEDNIRPELFEEEFRTAQLMNVKYEYTTEDSDHTVKVEIPRFQLTKGDRICLYGESGQGKSTLLNILSGEISTNDVIINGEYRKERLDCVFITQDTEILDMSLRDNLTLGKEVDDNEIINLLDKCGLKDWYDKQPNGLDTILGERGVFVSTGQRQRLNIIRGLLVKDKEIYLLDEPTSNVDEITESKLIEVLKEYLSNKTVIVVTHRPKIKEICTKAYEFKNGILGKEQILFE